jgi:hypothetical protein
VIADVALPVPYDWLLLGSRLMIAAILLAFLWRVMIVVARDTFATSATAPLAVALLDEADRPVRAFRLSRRKPMTIGRDSSNDIVLTDRSVSGHHAVIRYIAGEWIIGDLDSRNGTFVNGSLIAREASIAEGDIVQFGGIRVRVVANESQF